MALHRFYCPTLSHVGNKNIRFHVFLFRVADSKFLCLRGRTRVLYILGQQGERCAALAVFLLGLCYERQPALPSSATGCFGLPFFPLRKVAYPFNWPHEVEANLASPEGSQKWTAG